MSAPTLLYISPTSEAEDTAFDLHCYGTNFDAGNATIHVGATAMPTTYVDPTEVYCAVSAYEFAADTYDVTVQTDDGQSGVEELEITAADNPVPTLTSIAPDERTEGQGDFNLVCTGTDFVSGCVVTVDAVARSTSFVSATECNADLLTGDQSVHGTRAIRVVNPTPGGGASDPVNLTVNNPEPVLTGLAPDTVAEDSGAVTLHCYGSGFSADSVVRFDGVARTTTFINSGHVTAALPDTDTDDAGTFAITVYTPTPGGGESGSRTFTVTASPPVGQTGTDASDRVALSESASVATRALGGWWPECEGGGTVPTAADVVDEESWDEADATGYAPYAVEVLRDEPVGFWRLQETTGTDAEDSSPNGIDCVYQYTGFITRGRSGPVAGGSAVREDSSAVMWFARDDVDAALRVAGAFSIELWRYAVADPSNYASYIVRCGTDWASQGNFLLYCFNGMVPSLEGRVRLMFSSGGTLYSVAGNVATMALGAWTHIVATYDPDVGGRIYLNGVLASEDLTTGGKTQYQGDGDVMAATALNEEWAEVAIYNRALSAGRVQAHYGAAGTTKLVPTGEKPDVWVEVTTTPYPAAAATTTRRAQLAMAFPTKIEGRVRAGSFGTLERALSDWQGNVEAAVFGWEEEDSDGFGRALTAQLGEAAYANPEVAVKLLSELGRKTGLTPRIIQRGYLSKPPRPLPGRKARYESVDAVGSKFYAFNPEAPIQSVFVSREHLAPAGIVDTPDDVVGKPYNLVIGEHNDRGAVDACGTSLVKGLVPVDYVGKAILPLGAVAYGDVADTVTRVPPPVLVASVVGAGGDRTYYYAVTGILYDGGETQWSAVATVTNAPAPEQMTGSNYVHLSWTVPLGWEGVYDDVKAYRVIGRSMSQPRSYVAVLSNGGTYVNPETEFHDDAGAPELALGAPPCGTALVPVVDGTVVEGAAVWSVFVVALGAVHLLSIYGSDLADQLPVNEEAERLEPARVYILPSNVDVISPLSANWPHATDYVDVNGVRLTLFYARGPLAQAHIDGSVTFAVNCCGVEDVGDGTGVMISEAASGLQWLLNEVVLNKYQTGAYGTLASYADGTPILKTSSFTALQAATASFVGGAGYQMHLCLTEPVTLSEVLQWWCLTFTAHIGVTPHGQVAVFLVDPTTDRTSLRHLREKIELDEHLPEAEVAEEEVENRIAYRYDWDADGQDYRTAVETVEDLGSQAMYGLRVPDDEFLGLRCTRDPVTAAHAMGRRLRLNRWAPVYHELPLGLDGLERTLGELVRVTHTDGITEDGYEEHVFFVVKHRMELNGPRMRVVLLGRYVDHLIVVAKASVPGASTRVQLAEVVDRQVYGDWVQSEAVKTGLIESSGDVTVVTDTKQVFMSAFPTISDTTRVTRLFHRGGTWWFNSGGYENNVKTPWPVAGTFRNFLLSLSAAPGVGKTKTFTILVNGVASGLTISVSGSDTTGTCVGTDVAVAAGDHLSVYHEATAGTADAVGSYSVEFHPAVFTETAYGSNFGQASNSAARYNGFLRSDGSWSTSLDYRQDIFAAAGTLTRMDVYLDTAPGGGKSWTYVVMLNGVAQDGTGGTIDTSIVISDSETAESRTFALAVAAGDRVGLRSTPSGGPANSCVGVGVKFVPTTPGQWMVAGGASDYLSASATEYNFGHGGIGVDSPEYWTGTEADRDLDGAVTPFVLSRLFVRLITGTPGASKSFTFSPRRSAASPSAVPSVTLTGSAVDGSDLTGSLFVGLPHTWDMQCVPSGTPSALAAAIWGMVATASGELEEVEAGDGVKIGVGEVATAEEATETKQVLITRALNPSSAANPTYGAVASDASFITTTANCHPWSATGTFRNLSIRLGAAPGSGKSWTFCLQLDGVDSDLTVTVSDAETTGTCTGVDVPVTAGQQIRYHVTPSGTPANPQPIYLSVEFEGTVAKSSGYAVQAWLPSTSAARWQGPVIPMAALCSPNATSGAAAQNVFAAAGTVTRMDAILVEGAAGTGKSYEFSLYLNGVKQDGTGGTVDTRVTISGASDTSGYATFSLPIAAGDCVYVECTPSGTPTQRNVATSIAFVADTAGEWLVCGANVANLSGVATAYSRATAHGAPGAWSGTESTMLLYGGLSSVVLSKMRLVLAGAPGAGTSFTLSARLNSGSPAGMPSVQVADSATTGSDLSNTVTVDDGDTLDVRSVPSGSPTATTAYWGWVGSGA